MLADAEAILGWALTYTVRWGRPLDEDEERAYAQWTAKHFALEPVVPDFEKLEGWRGMLPDEQIEKKKRDELDRRARELSVHPEAVNADFHGWFQTRSEASYRRAVLAFQQLEALFPFAQIELSDDYYSSRSRPSQIDLARAVPVKQPSKRRREEPIEEELLPPDEEAALEAAQADAVAHTRGEVEQLLEKARADFEAWKRRK